MLFIVSSQLTDTCTHSQLLFHHLIVILIQEHEIVGMLFSATIFNFSSCQVSFLSLSNKHQVIYIQLGYYISLNVGIIGKINDKE